MRRLVRAVAVFSLTLGAGVARAQSGDRVAAAASAQRIIVRGDLSGANLADYGQWRPALQRLYAAPEGRLIWTVDGRLTVQAESVIAVLASSDALGLVAEEYDATGLRARAATLTDSNADRGGEATRFDVWLSLSLMRYMQHVHLGRVDPRTLRIALSPEAKRVDLAALTLATSEAGDVRARLAELEPRYSRYALLKGALARYRTLASDTSLHVPPAATRSIRPGDLWRGSSGLRRLLEALGDLGTGSALADGARDEDLYDSTLAGGVKRFQARHGLGVDGILGRSTIQQLRQPLSARVQQIELALERWRWVPDDTSERFVLVNIPEFRMRVFERGSSGDRTVMAMDIIVGEARRRRFTPVFSAVMRDVIFRPYWEVPVRIARNEETPKIRRRPAYFASEEMEIVAGSDEDVVRYPPTAENLAKVDAGVLRLRQRPGAKNALGLVKFVFPNEYNAYLHGTPAQSLFELARRDFSHGCMRVREPATLADVVLAREGGWDPARIDSTMNGAVTVRVGLTHPIPVYVLYLTALPDDSGAVFFSPDIYRHDAALLAALRKRT